MTDREWLAGLGCAHAVGRRRLYGGIDIAQSVREKGGKGIV